MPQAAAKPKAKKPTLTGHATSSTSVKMKVKGGSKTVKNCKLVRSYSKINLKKHIIHINGNRLKANSFTLKKNKTYTITIKGLKKNSDDYYKVGKKGYYSNEVYIENGVPTLTVTPDMVNKGIRLKWTALSDSKGYEIYRGLSEDEAERSKTPYRVIKSKKKTKFTDMNIRPGIAYYYCVKGRKNKHRSNVQHTKIVDAEMNMNLARQSKLFENVAINSDANWEANSYSVNGGKHPYIKYRFTGEKLEMHLYIDFLHYDIKQDTSDGVFFTKTEDPQIEQNGQLCINTFINGLMSEYNGVYIDPKQGDFDDSVGSFTLELKVHRARTETFNPNQRFVEVRIGGVAPVDYKTYELIGENTWFHQNRFKISEGIYEAYIHMPTNEQLANNPDPATTIPFSLEDYMKTAAHEMGHALGLDDAYPMELSNGVKIDRCTTNGETCLKEATGKKDDPYAYHNLMRNQYSDKSKIRPNDVEMLLLAYKSVCSRTKDTEYEKYKDYGSGAISEAIKNREDEYDETQSNYF